MKLSDFIARKDSFKNGVFHQVEGTDFTYISTSIGLGEASSIVSFLNTFRFLCIIETLAICDFVFSTKHYNTTDNAIMFDANSVNDAWCVYFSYPNTNENIVLFLDDSEDNEPPVLVDISSEADIFTKAVAFDINCDGIEEYISISKAIEKIAKDLGLPEFTLELRHNKLKEFLEIFELC